MKTYSIINQKGGVGKSTTASAIAAGLANKGAVVLLVDLDAQGNLSYSLGVDNTGLTGASSLDVLTRAATIEDAALYIKSGAIVKSSPALSGADMVLTTTGKEYRLREALDKVGGKYDYCVIDTPPALGILTINALTASNAAIVPAQADIFSLNGIAQLYQTVEAVQAYTNKELTIEGILLTRFSSRSVISRDIAEALTDTAAKLHTRVFDTKIRECTALKEAQASRESIFDYAPKSNAALDYAALVEEILKGATT